MTSEVYSTVQGDEKDTLVVPRQQLPAHMGSVIEHQNAFTFGLFGCCEDGAVACDVALCAPFMLGRACDAVLYSEPDSVNLLACCGAAASEVIGVSLFAGMCFGLHTPVSVLFLALGNAPAVGMICQQRKRLRQHVGLPARDYEDILATILCTPCTLCQVIREANHLGLNPGGCCCLSRHAPVLHSRASLASAQPAYDTSMTYKSETS